MYICIGYRLSPTTYSKETRFIIESLIRVLSTIKSNNSNDAMRCDCDAIRYDWDKVCTRSKSAMRCDAMRCDATWCETTRCDAMRCDFDAMRCDAMAMRLRCDAIRLGCDCDAIRLGCDAMLCFVSFVRSPTIL